MSRVSDSTDADITPKGLPQKVLILDMTFDDQLQYNIVVRLYGHHVQGYFFVTQGCRVSAVDEFNKPLGPSTIPLLEQYPFLSLLDGSTVFVNDSASYTFHGQQDTIRISRSTCEHTHMLSRLTGKTTQKTYKGCFLFSFEDFHEDTDPAM